MFGKMVSNMMVRPGGSPVFGDPRDYGLDHEDVAFKASDGVTLRGWLIKGDPRRVIVQSHFGLMCSRSGYSPKGRLIKLWKDDIAFLRQAQHLNQQGYTVLMYDMRNHGESNRGHLPWCSWGAEEAKDVLAAVDFIAKHPRYGDADIGLLSICLGAVASTYAYGLGDEGLGRYEKIKAMVAVQPVHYREFVRATGLPQWLVRASGKVSRKRLGFDLETKSFMPDVKSITAPTLVMQNRNDPLTDLDFVQRYYDELRVDKELLWLDLVKSRGAAYDYLGTAPEKLAGFFGKHL